MSEAYPAMHQPNNLRELLLSIVMAVQPATDALMREGFMSKLNCRQFLGGLGALGLMPFVSVLNAHGAETSGPKRLVLIYTPHGTIRIDGCRRATPTTFRLMELQPLTALKHKVSIVDGLKIRADSIGAPHTRWLDAYVVDGLWFVGRQHL